MWKKVLKMDGSSTQRFLRLTGPLAPRVVVSPLRAMSMKSALRDWLSESYGMISTTVISHLRWLFPLWWLAPPPCPVGSMSLDSRVAYSSPMNPVPLPPPQAGALWVLSNGAMSLQESIERFILSPGWGKVRCSRIRGSRAAANHQNANQAL